MGPEPPSRWEGPVKLGFSVPWSLQWQWLAPSPFTKLGEPQMLFEPGKMSAPRRSPALTQSEPLGNVQCILGIVLRIHLHVLFPVTKDWWWVGVKEGGILLSAHCPSQLPGLLGRLVPEEVNEEQEQAPSSTPNFSPTPKAT